MQKLRLILMLLVITGIFVLAGCALNPDLPSPTAKPSSTPSETPAPTASPLPTVTPQMPEGPYPPVVLEHSPLTGQEVLTDTAITLRFDQPMNRASVAAALQVSPDVEGDLTWSGDAVAVFHPKVLASNTRYRVTVGAEAHSVAGLPLSMALDFAFSTLSPLAVTQITPSDAASDVRIDAPVIVAFNRAVVPLTCVGEDAGADCPQLPLSFEPAVIGKGYWVNTSLYRFDTLKGWGAGRTYAVTLDATVESVEGTQLPGPVMWTFSTALPVIVDVEPADGQFSVAIDTGVRVTFNTPMDRELTGRFFNLVDADGEIVPGAITWQDNGAVLVFTPTQSLALGSEYTVRIGTRARAATSAPLQNPQTWTFATVPTPELLSVTPGRGATAVKLVEPVRIVFAGAIDASTLQEHVTVTPTTQTPYTYFDAETGVYQLSWDKTPRTEYCIDVLPGIADIYGHTIDEVVTSCFVTGDLDAFLGPVTSLDAITLDADAPAQLHFLVRNRNSARFSLTRLEPVDFTRGWNTEGVSVRQWTQTFSGARNATNVAEVMLNAGRRLSPGYYQLAWENPPWGTQSLRIAVVDRHVTLKLAQQEALVWVTDLHSAEPVSRTAVQLKDSEGLLIAAGTTDEDGLAAIPISPRDDLWESVAAIVGEPGVPGFGVALTHWMADAAPWAFDIIMDGDAPLPYNVSMQTDRPIYRPGQPVYFKGIIREFDSQYRLPAPDLPVTVTLRSPLGDAVYSATLGVSDFGTFDGNYTLADDAPVGEYVLETTLPGVPFERPWTIDFSVAAYRKPDFEVRVTPEHNDILEGESLRVLIAGEYYFGGPIDRAKLEWAVRAEDAPFEADVAGGWTWGAHCPGQDRSESQIVAEGEAETGDSGQFLLGLPAQLSFEDAAAASCAQRWTIEATLLDESGFPVSERAAVVVHPARFNLGLRLDSWVVRAAARTDVEILALDWAQNPAAGREIDVTLAERVWQRVSDVAAVALPVWVYTDTEVSTVRVTTGADGHAVASVLPPRAGTYVVVAEALDSGGRRVRSEVTLWVSGANAVQWRTEEGKVTPVADARTYQVGDTARVLVPTPFDGPYQMLMTIERDGLLFVRRQLVVEPNPIVEIPIEWEHIPNVYVSFVLVRPVSETTTTPDVRVGYVRLDVEPTTQILTVEITPDKTVYGPGDSVALNVRALDAAGRAVDAELGVAVVDKGVLALRKPNTSPLRDVFYGERPLRVVTGDTLMVLFNRISSRIEAFMRDVESLVADAGGVGGGAEPVQDVPIRGSFLDTSLWAARVRTRDSRGAQLTFDLPDSLTTWVVDARAVTADSQVGEAQAELVVTKPLLVRPVSPRFFVVGDYPEVAAVIHNNTADALEVTARLVVESGAVHLGPEAQTLTVPAGGRARVTWALSIAPTAADAVALVFSAEGGGYSDVVRPSPGSSSDEGLPLYRYVSLDVAGTAGVLPDVGERVETLILPEQASDASALSVRVESSMAGALVDNLTVLEQYPYASTDVLVGRFLSNVLTYRALQDMRVRDDALNSRLLAQVNDALDRLYARQNPDGGWGWWEGPSQLPMSAYAALGLVRAEQAGFEVRKDALDRAVTYVHDTLGEALQLDARPTHEALALYVLAEARVSWPSGAGSELYAAREALGVVGRGYLALAYGSSDPSDPRVPALLDGLRGAAVVSATGAHWESADSLSWSTDTVATAVGLDVLARFAPEDPLLPQAVRWLMTARRANSRETVYETAWATIGLTDMLLVSGDTASDFDWHVALNGDVLFDSVSAEGTSLGLWRTRIGVPVVRKDGVNVLQIVRGSGSGSLYYTAHFVPALPADGVVAENRGFVLRRTYCAVAGAAQVPTDVCVPVADLRAGDLVDVHITLVVPEMRHFVALEDSYPAGMEPASVNPARSAALLPVGGVGYGVADVRDPFIRREFRDERAVFFAQELPAGTYEVVYRLRAVVPGTYNVLPVKASEIYFPEVWGRSDGQEIVVLPASP